MIRPLLDFIFPPFCLSCKQRCETKVLCPDCWLLCELPDPVTRCRHCFEELDARGNLCKQCRHQKHLSAIRAYVFDPESPAFFLGTDAVEAMAGFAVLQWIQLEWPLPGSVIPMPDRESIAIGRAFADFLEVPFVPALKSDYSYKIDRLEEDEELLVFDVSNPRQTLQKGTSALAESFPKRIYILSLLPYGDPLR